MSGSETQDQILDAVQSVIVREGVRGASMRQVAQEADVSLGLISYHFDDKESLIFAAFDRATSAIRDASVEAAAKVSGDDEKVVEYLRGSFSDSFLNSDYLRLRVSLWAVSLTDPELAKVDIEYCREYARTLEGLIGLARPHLAAAKIEARTADVIALTNGLWLDWARFHGDEDLERGLALAEAIALAP
jgi:AcrR family transcriptional regulator